MLEKYSTGMLRMRCVCHRTDARMAETYPPSTRWSRLAGRGSGPTSGRVRTGTVSF